MKTPTLEGQEIHGYASDKTVTYDGYWYCSDSKLINKFMDLFYILNRLKIIKITYEHDK